MIWVLLGVWNIIAVGKIVVTVRVITHHSLTALALQGKYTNSDILALLVTHFCIFWKQKCNSTSISQTTNKLPALSLHSF